MSGRGILKTFLALDHPRKWSAVARRHARTQGSLIHQRILYGGAASEQPACLMRKTLVSAFRYLDGIHTSARHAKVAVGKHRPKVFVTEGARSILVITPARILQPARNREIPDERNSQEPSLAKFQGAVPCTCGASSLTSGRIG